MKDVCHDLFEPSTRDIHDLNLQLAIKLISCDTYLLLIT